MADAASRAGRRWTDPVLGAGEPSSVDSSLPVEPAKAVQNARKEQAGAFEAQLFGQDGQKRGLRGGKPLRDHARSAYLGAEFAGPLDRRPPKGLLTKTKI